MASNSELVTVQRNSLVFSILRKCPPSFFGRGQSFNLLIVNLFRVTQNRRRKRCLSTGLGLHFRAIRMVGKSDRKNLSSSAESRE